MEVDALGPYRNAPNQPTHYVTRGLVPDDPRGRFAAVPSGFTREERVNGSSQKPTCCCPGPRLPPG
jgi:hypothetical protein